MPPTNGCVHSIVRVVNRVIWREAETTKGDISQKKKGPVKRVSRLIASLPQQNLILFQREFIQFRSIS